MTHKKLDKEQIDAAFSVDGSALYLILQFICPECRKVLRLQYLADAKSMKTT